jgi:hydantoinase/carbamoylase family amidase
MVMDLLKNRVQHHIEQLELITSTPQHGVTRLVYTEEEALAKNYIKEEMEMLSLEIQEDEFGNIFALWRGEDPNLLQIWTGSHLDAPTHGGKYDGVTGVIGSLEAIRLLKESGFTPKRDIVLAVLVSEEPTRFGVGCLGSRALVGAISNENLDNWKDENGQSLREVLMKEKRNPELVLQQQLNAENIKSFIELHIEQGEILERENKTIGIVNAIAAPTEILLIIKGEQRHAGTTSMDMRKDPVPAASEIVLLVEDLVKRKLGKDGVGTVGKMVITPNTSNVIAQKVELSIDIRDIDKEKKDEVIKNLKSNVISIMEQRELDFEWLVKSDDTPAIMNQELIKYIEEICIETEVSYLRMNSGAYHDAMILSRKVPANMIFVPSHLGISHAPEEFTFVSDIVKGIEVLSKILGKVSID